ncbi:MAG: hypothetical protein KatS3mg104_2504 [Phycisphaerae bacterium]|jgi:hypothetical protein|nr:MAG: hypothetical protein KatS3mg104_2504 [Phycisphaerae bacterium]
MTDMVTAMSGSPSFITAVQTTIHPALQKAADAFANRSNCGAVPGEDAPIFVPMMIFPSVSDTNSLLYTIYHQLTVGSFGVHVAASPATIKQKCDKNTLLTTFDWKIIYSVSDEWHLHLDDLTGGILPDPGYWRTWQWSDTYRTQSKTDCACFKV